LSWSRSSKGVQGEISTFYLTQLAFWAGQEDENEFAVPGDRLKHPLLDLTQVLFWAGDGQKIGSKCCGCT